MEVGNRKQVLGLRFDPPAGLLGQAPVEAAGAAAGGKRSGDTPATSCSATPLGGSGTSTSVVPSVAPSRWCGTSPATPAGSPSPTDAWPATTERPSSSATSRPCRRFLQHVLPRGFVRIRRYGLLSNRVRKPLLDHCREPLGAEPPLRLAPPDETCAAACRRIFGSDPNLCPTCKHGRLVVRDHWPATRLPLHLVIAGLSPRAP